MFCWESIKFSKEGRGWHFSRSREKTLGSHRVTVSTSPRPDARGHGCTTGAKGRSASPDFFSPG
eukprot:3800603-Alexandrium_andersonii.AAC.1